MPPKGRERKRLSAEVFVAEIRGEAAQSLNAEGAILEAFRQLLSTELKTFHQTPAAKSFVAVCYGKVWGKRCLLCRQLHHWACGPSTNTSFGNSGNGNRYFIGRRWPVFFEFVIYYKFEGFDIRGNCFKISFNL